MSKKDYVAIAQILNDAYRATGNDMATVMDITGRLIPMFGADNPNFDARRFTAAVIKEDQS